MNQENVKHNERAFMRLVNLIYPFAGCCAGIMGCTSFYGLAVYVTTTILVALLWSVLTNLSSKYGSWTIMANTVNGIPSFLLFWTLCYGLVYVYD